MNKKEYVEYHEAKPFLDWLTKQPRKITKHIEFELTWPHHMNKEPALVTFYCKEDQLDVFDLYSAFKHSVAEHSQVQD